MKYVAEATTLNVLNHGLGLCSVLRGKDDEPSVVSGLTDVDVRCEADIIVRGVNDNVVVKSTNAAFLSDVVVDIVGISADATGGSISGENSNVQVAFPVAGDYEVAASGSRLSQVETADCEVADQDATNLSLTCGAGGPVYEVTAKDDDEPSRMNIYVR